MAGTGQEQSSFYKGVSRDRTTRNARITNNLQIPIYSQANICESPAIPAVSQEGQIIFHSVTGQVLVSTTFETGNLHWQALTFESCQGP